jgi:hypothetical protein
MARDNVGWGAPRIHGELLKLGFVVSEATVSPLIPGGSGQVVGEERAPSLRGRLGRAAAIDFFVVSRASRLLRVSLISDLVVDKFLITGRATGYCCPVGRSHDGLRKPSDRATKLSLLLPIPRYHQGRPHSISCSARSRWSRKLLK